MSELDEIRLDAYENSRIYKEKNKVFHDKRIIPRNFKFDENVLLFNYQLKLFPAKLKSRWCGPFKIKKVKSYVAIILWSKADDELKICGQYLNPYLVDDIIKEGTTVSLLDFTIS